MARVCELTGKKVSSGNNVSHSNRHTRRTFRPNLQEKTYHSPLLGRNVTLRLSTRAIRTIDKYNGLEGYLLQVRNKRVREDFSGNLAYLRFLMIKKTLAQQTA